MLQAAALLRDLYRQQRALRPSDPYLQAHARVHVASTQAAVFDFYSKYLPSTGRVLDWGCRHAPDAAMLRSRCGTDLRIDGCDFVDADTYSAFHAAAGLNYRKLDDTVRLPYESGTFDAVIASGTLEHAAMDYESLKELYRVLKDGGTLIVTYLPNRWSFEEWHRRRIRREGFHRRFYTLAEAISLLKHTGFYPQRAGFQTALDLLAPRSLKHHLLRLACHLLPLHRFASTIAIVAEKVPAMRPAQIRMKIRRQ